MSAVSLWGVCPIPDKSAIIDELIQLRKAQGLTQRDLAKAANLAQPAIARLENKTATPQLDTILKVLAPLGKTLAIVPLDTQNSQTQSGIV